MRKRTINSLFDTIFWYAIYLIPVIAYIYFTLVSPYNATSSFTMFFENLGISFVNDNIIFTSYSAFIISLLHLFQLTRQALYHNNQQV